MILILFGWVILGALPLVVAIPLSVSFASVIFLAWPAGKVKRGV